MGLGHMARAVNLVVQADQNAPACRLRLCRQAYGIKEIHGAIRAEGRSRAHGAGQDYRLPAMHGEMQKIGRLLQGVCAVGDDYAICIPRQQLIAAGSQLQPGCPVHILAVETCNLLPCDLRHFPDGRHRTKKRLHPQSACLIAGGSRVRSSTARNRAPRCQYGNPWFSQSLHLPLSQIRPARCR